MHCVKKCVLVPYQRAQMFELVDDVELVSASSCHGARGAQRARAGRQPQDGAHRHRLSRRARAFHDRQREPAARVDRHHAEGWPVPALAWRMALSGAGRARLQGRVRPRLRVRDGAARQGDRAGVQPHRRHVHRRVRQARRSGLRASATERRVGCGYTSPTLRRTPSFTSRSTSRRVRPSTTPFAHRASSNVSAYRPPQGLRDFRPARRG